MKTVWKMTVIVVIILVTTGLYLGRSLQKSDNAGANFIEPGRTGKPMLLDLGSIGCVPCQMMAPVLEELGKEYHGIDVQIIDINERKDLADRYRIYAVPTQIFFNTHGKEVYRHEGFLAKQEIVKQLKNLHLIN